MGFLIHAMRLSIADFNLDPSILISHFDGHHHLPPLLQDALADRATSQIHCASYCRVESLVAGIMIDWIDKAQEAVAIDGINKAREAVTIYGLAKAVEAITIYGINKAQESITINGPHQHQHHHQPPILDVGRVLLPRLVLHLLAVCQLFTLTTEVMSSSWMMSECLPLRYSSS